MPPDELLSRYTAAEWAEVRIAAEMMPDRLLLVLSCIASMLQGQVKGKTDRQFSAEDFYFMQPPLERSKP